MRFPVLAQSIAEGAIRVGAIALDREHAVEMSGELLVASGRTTPAYTEEMVAVLETHGPYIVIAPGIALAHSKPSDLVIETGLSLLTLAEPVVFGNAANDPVSLLIGLAAFDHDSHMDMMKELADALSDQQFVNSLLNAGDTEEIRQLL
ncbi:PTS sugar transporter subunit IIA [Rhodoluna sp.]|jgi:PTS system ascorbate-specific IIA component|uniref:PTS sugar transporter subunit IIA n=1 Tax=Rhodoluna sp. TaxID=1969481 RepID=UPI0025F5215C|nr:PTS sugar transporter subunit IIA [Rhodoluna sp.]